MRRSTWIATSAAVLVAFLLALAWTAPAGPRSMRQFDPDRLASLEVRMWQADDAGQRVTLFSLLTTMLREQYRYSWAAATVEAFHLARAAARFGDLAAVAALDNTALDRAVLPDLEAAYERARSWTDASFDPRAVARAELAWWVARRVPGRNSPEQIGLLIADEYTLLYESSRERMAPAAELRARAGALRDAHADHPDWARILELLQQSYRELHAALQSTNVRIDDSSVTPRLRPA
jgi:hypothetical protein